MGPDAARPTPSSETSRVKPLLLVDGRTRAPTLAIHCFAARAPSGPPMYRRPRAHAAIPASFGRRRGPRSARPPQRSPFAMRRPASFLRLRVWKPLSCGREAPARDPKLGYRSSHGAHRTPAFGKRDGQVRPISDMRAVEFDARKLAFRAGAGIRPRLRQIDTGQVPSRSRSMSELGRRRCLPVRNIGPAPSVCDSKLASVSNFFDEVSPTFDAPLRPVVPFAFQSAETLSQEQAVVVDASVESRVLRANFPSARDQLIEQRLKGLCGYVLNRRQIQNAKSQIRQVAKRRRC